MRNETESSRASSNPSSNLNGPPAAGPDGRGERGRAALASAFSPAFLESFQRRASRLEGLPASGPSALAPTESGGAAFWAGPWEVERAEAPHGPVWKVARRGEAVAEGGRPVAETRHRADAVVLAATLPALAVPNRVRLAEKGKRLGFPLHDGAACVGHLSHPEPRVVELLHAVRTLLTHPECLALAVEALDAEELPIVGRALMRRVEAGAM